MRRPPLGPVPPKAHDMAREYRWLAALNPVFPLAPRPYLLCEDPSVIGSVFYVMERRRGIVVRHDEPMSLANHPETRRRVSEALVDTLADLHARRHFRVRRSPLLANRPASSHGRSRDGPSDGIGSRIDDVPEMDSAGDLAGGASTADPVQPAVVHGDFKLDNVLLDPLDLGQLVAVFDWEMSALGDPLVDLGILLAYWSPTAPPLQQDALDDGDASAGLFEQGRDRRRDTRRDPAAT